MHVRSIHLFLTISLICLFVFLFIDSLFFSRILYVIAILLLEWNICYYVTALIKCSSYICHILTLILLPSENMIIISFGTFRWKPSNVTNSSMQFFAIFLDIFHTHKNKINDDFLICVYINVRRLLPCFKNE